MKILKNIVIIYNIFNIKFFFQIVQGFDTSHISIPYRVPQNIQRVIFIKIIIINNIIHFILNFFQHLEKLWEENVI